MADAFYGEISIFPYTFPPQDWMICDGSSLMVQQYQVLYAVIGVTYGGSGVTDFNIPDLSHRAPLGYGTGAGLTPYQIGVKSGYLSVQLCNDCIPAHKHKLVGSLDVGSNAPEHTNESFPSFMDKKQVTSVFGYADGNTSSLVQMSAKSLSVSGSYDYPQHENRQPYTVMEYCICVEGEWPQRQ
ncbi:MAG: tail fiber protein [Opitutales bacterium]|nr:tail fiber protein [Opitutales bacterium]